MTIHTKWMELLRQKATDAFEYGAPRSVTNASFIDGQIKLMISEATQTWSDMLYSKFTSVIMRHYTEYRCTTVVLAFDDKRYVPKAKAITQLKRRANVNIIEFTDTDVLPCDLPTEWKEAIMNPWFKHRVIELICANVPRLVTPPSGCRLIVDWETVTEYVYGDQAQPIVNVIPTETNIGEADLKFTRWARALETSMLIEATDGDYIPISFGLMASGFVHPITILKAWNQDKGMEFIDIDVLHEFVRRTFHTCARGNVPRGCAWWEVKLFITLLGLSGTDFTRNLPLISPQKMWDALPLIIQTFEMEDDATIDASQGKRIVELLYADAFPKHIDPFERCSIWGQAQASKLGARNKALIPTDARIMCTMRNLNFLLVYWLKFQAPERIQDFGFRVGPQGVIEWDD